MQSKSTVFSSLENIIGEKIPESIIFILTETGYDSRLALKRITAEKITGIEDHINADIANLSYGLVGTRYENVRPFKLLPGHRALIESLPQYLDEVILTGEPAAHHQSNEFTQILKLLIESAEINTSREAKGRRYNECLKYFCTYVYLMCGRACYETLSANLPLPQASTICTYF